MGQPNQQRWLGLALLLLSAIGLFGLSTVRQSSVENPRELALLDEWADEDSCVECHQEAENFFDTGHAQTLRLATHEASLNWLSELRANQKLKEEGTEIILTPATVESAVFRVTAKSQRENAPHSELSLDWCFGSGHHAATWVHTLADSSGATDLLEFRWSYYNTKDETVDITPGQPDSPQPGYFGHLGILFDGPKATRCFSCHASALPVNHGKIDQKLIKPGITCQRCHGGRLQHVESGGEFTDTRWLPTSQEDAVNRCAQCHRRASEMPQQDINTSNTDIVRFQPVGLVQSKCYQDPKMTCTTCHDPHKPMDPQSSRGIWQCVQCHNPQESEHVLCGDGNSDDCLACHMPKAKMDSPLFFTDHWIRVREPEE